MLLYNLFPLLAGPFTAWRPHLQRAAAMGFEWVFINPIQQLGASKSLYSIADYFSFNPVFVDAAKHEPPEVQFRSVVEGAHELGLKLIMDLVINHCAIDSPLTCEHPEWFVRHRDGRIANAVCQDKDRTVVWKDLAQFDHAHTRDPEGLYNYCLKVVRHLLGLGFSGFRCDAAYQVPRKVWSRLIRDTRRERKDALFIAETLGCNADQTKETARAGFDYVFNSAKYWNFRDWWLLAHYNLLREKVRSISFPESHDTRRLSEEFNGNINALKQRYLFSAFFSSGLMMPMGFEVGLQTRLHVVNTTPGDWQRNGIDLSPYITNVNAMKKSHALFLEEGPTTLLNSPNPNVLFMWKGSVKRPQEALLILNKDPWNYQEFYVEQLRPFIYSGAPLSDLSPEYRLDYIPEPFHYALRPGQGIVLTTNRG